jgi:hypothetical protein
MNLEFADAEAIGQAHLQRTRSRRRQADEVFT